jgi:hypothetical protein
MAMRFVLLFDTMGRDAHDQTHRGPMRAERNGHAQLLETAPARWTKPTPPLSGGPKESKPAPALSMKNDPRILRNPHCSLVTV